MQMAAHRPQEIFAFLEGRQFVAREDALDREFLRRIGGVDEFGDPEKRVEIAQAALAVLDIGLDQIAARTRLVMPLVALAKLARDEGLGTARHDVFAKAT